MTPSGPTRRSSDRGPAARHSRRHRHPRGAARHRHRRPHRRAALPAARRRPDAGLHARREQRARRSAGHRQRALRRAARHPARRRRDPPEEDQPMTPRSRMLAAVLASATLLAACGDTDDPSSEANATPEAAQDAPASIRLLTHDSFALSDGVLDQFTERSEEHTSELQSLMRLSDAVFGLKTHSYLTL